MYSSRLFPQINLKHFIHQAIRCFKTKLYKLIKKKYLIPLIKLNVNSSLKKIL